MSLTLRQLELFCAVADNPTLSAAAEQVHLSESALSHAITQLEQTLGVQLCVRRKARGVRVTPTGRMFAERGGKILREIAELTNDVAAREGRMVGEVVIGCFTTLTTNLLPHLLHRMPEQHPGLTVRVVVGTQEELLAKVADGEVDFAFLYDQFLPATLSKETIYHAEEMAVLHAAHPLAREDAVSVQDLAGEPLVLLDATPSVPNVHTIFAVLGLTPRIVAAVPEIDLVRALVGRGIGSAVLMSRPTGTETTLEGHRIVFRRLVPPRPRTAVVAVWPHDGMPTARARAVVAFAQAGFASSEPGATAK